VAYTQPAIEAGSTRTGRWLRERRIKIALWTAVVEGLIVLAVIVLAFYIVAGRSFKWDVARELSWVAAASQVLAIFVVIFAFILKLIAIVIIIGFALAALVYLWADHRQQRT
jgi:hypothetical protein